MVLSLIPGYPIAEADLTRLIDAQAPEGQLIDYKQTMPGGSDSDRKDFLADISSFANAKGGCIIYGISEDEGLPIDLIGLNDDVDKAILRLENMARDGIRPAIPGLEFIRIPLASGLHAIVVRIPKSWNPPHQVTFKRDYRFYTRGSAGKQHVDVEELRHIVLASQESGDRIRAFRANRVAAVISGDMPIELNPGARQILHFIPLNALGPGTSVDLGIAKLDPGLFVNITNRGGSYRHNLDGLLSYSPVRDGGAEAYGQLFRTGKVEVVTQWEARERGGRRLLPSGAWEHELQSQTRSVLRLLKILEVTSPIALLLSFVGLRGWEMGVRDGYGTRRAEGFDRDPILVPDLLLETTDVTDVAGAIRPIVDATWNAAGFEKSDYYGDDGGWREPL